MLSFPNAKINIGLRVTNLRDDGYHHLESIFYPIGWHDALEIIPSTHSDDSFHPSGKLIEGNAHENLVIKAYLLLKEKYRLPPIDIYLDKHIPMGAGMGGGSADGAFMLKLLNDFFKLNISINELEVYAAQLGSDCAFFIQNKPALAQGRGNELTICEPLLMNYQALVIYPNIHISTKEAYMQLQRHVHPNTPLMELYKLPIAEWKNYIFNDFENYAFQQFPQLQTLKEMLYQQGALYASMTGSGSAIYGIFAPQFSMPTVQIEYEHQQFIL
jgi:4-diphosphocytidyl-2-C-methyl-D-erythritol kinase